MQGREDTPEEAGDWAWVSDGSRLRQLLTSWNFLVYWVGQKVHSRFCVILNGKIQMDVLINLYKMLMGVITLLVLFPWLYLPDAGKIEGKRRRGQPRMRWLDSLTGSMHMNLSKLWEIEEDRGAWCATVQEATPVTQRVNNTCLGQEPQSAPNTSLGNLSLSFRAFLP